MLMLLVHPCSAGLDSYTELDRVNGWLIERRQGSDGALSCRAFLPSGASWFSGNTVSYTHLTLPTIFGV